MNGSLETQAVELAETLLVEGYAVAPAETHEGFMRLCGMIGSIRQTTSVRITPGKEQYPFRPNAVPFHTDHPTIPTVAWFCESQDAEGGANLLIDTRDIVRTIPEHHKLALLHTRLRVFHNEDTLPALSLSPYQVYWLPIVVAEMYRHSDDATREALDWFRGAVSVHHATGEGISVRLRHGEALFVNNRVMLHGRDSIRRDSRRSLIRAYIA